MTVLKSLPHPLVHLRNLLLTKYPLSEAKIKAAASARGLVAVPHDTFVSQTETKPLKSEIVVKSAPFRIQRVAIAETGDLVYRRLQRILGSLEVRYFTGGLGNPDSRAINISQTDQSIVFALLKNWFSNDESVGVETADGYAEDLNLFFSKKLGPITYLRLCVRESEPGSSKYCSSILLNFWQEKIQYGEDSIFESSIVNPFVKRIKSSTYKELQVGNRDVDDLSKKVPSAINFPVDVVYTWVNDQDDDWREERDSHALKAGRGAKGRSTHAERFKNRDELKYSLRSVELFAPFVRNIYIVTNGQVPSWLNRANKKITIVSHAEIYTDPAALPTFNSSGIETQLHRIEGLSDRFLYFNDDFFLGRLTDATDFFHSNGVLKYFPTEQRVFEPDIDEHSEEYIIADANAIELLAEKYGAYGREIMMHAPYSCNRQLLYQMQEQWPQQYQNCSSQRFRSTSDLRPIAFMQYHAGYQEKLAIPSSITHRYLALWKKDIDKQLENVLKNKAYKTFCINDVGVDDEKVQWTDNLVSKFLNSYFPNKSSFEI